MSTDMIATVQGAAVAQLLRNMDPVATAQREQGIKLIDSVINENKERAEDLRAKSGALLTDTIAKIADAITVEESKPSPNASVLAAYQALLARVQ